MPKLYQVLQHELAGAPSLPSLPDRLLDGEVVKILLATGAPCESHACAFAAWPGSERNVTKWFRLEDGAAVGIRSRDGQPHGLAHWERQRDG